VTLADTLTFTVLTRNPSNGELTDADAVPAYRIYEAETATPILTGSLAKLDDANTTGFYSEAIACTTANGFETTKSYNIYITYTVAGGGSTNGETFGFKVWAANENLAGAGDYAVTLTIRTTGGTAIPGVSVWLNTASDRSGAVAGPQTTNDSGLVTFQLSYTAYNIYCHLAGYTFAAASMTPAAGSVTFTKDIGTAAVVGGDTGYSESFLTRAIAETRKHIDEPAINAKYTDVNIIQQLEFSYIQVLEAKNRNSMTPAVAKVTLTVAADTTEYILPYTIGSVVAIYEAEAYGGKLFYSSRSQYNPLGQRVWVEGNILRLQTAGLLRLGEEITVEYIPMGVARLHHGTCTLNAAGTIATFGATPNVGTLDTHANAYLGSVLRLINVDGTTVTGNYMQERPISAYDNTTRAATVTPAFDPVPTTDDGSIYYEIAPAIHRGLDMIVPIHAAYSIAAVEGNRKRAGTIRTLYQEAIRNVRLQAYYSNEKECTRLRGDNVDNRFYGR
jgi:hypothetical protein